MNEARLHVRDLVKHFPTSEGGRVSAVDGVDVAVEEGEILVLLGPSGCGKSTLLRCIAGLDEPDGGSIRIGNRVVFDAATHKALAPDRRNISMMFQSYALWPHMKVVDNIAYPLVARGAAKREARVRAAEYLGLVGMQGLEGRYPGQLSGGQQQRTALARALISDPALALFDEPLSNVDARVRVQLRRELLRIHRELGFAAIYVTHDQDEAMGVGDRIAVMDKGRIVQLGSPREVYEYPRTQYVAEFVGAANIVPATLDRLDGGNAIFSSTIGRVVGTASTAWNGRTPPPAGTEVLLVVRPEYCRITDRAPSVASENSWDAEIDYTIYAGSRAEYVCRVNGVPWTVWTGGSDVLPATDKARMTFPASAVRVVEAGDGS